jgi:hypothetical protein
MDYLSNNNLAYLSDDNVYKSTFGIVERNETIDNYDYDNEGGNEKNFLTDEQIQNLLENYENNSNNNSKNKKLLFITFFILFFLIFCCFIF